MAVHELDGISASYFMMNKPRNPLGNGIIQTTILVIMLANHYLIQCHDPPKNHNFSPKSSKGII